MKHRRNTLTLNYWKDGDWYVGQIVKIPAVISQGETLEELNKNILDAYELVVQHLKDTVTSNHPRSRSKTIEVPVLAC
jgi:predicted RNase H-like HicB family nuclease